MGNHKQIATGIAAIPLQACPKRGELSATEHAVCREMGLTPEAYREANPVLPAVTERPTTGQRLSEAELAVCREAGISPEAYRKANPATTSAAGRRAETAGLSETELAVCRGMGLSPQAYWQANREEGSPHEVEALITEGLQDGRIAGAATAAWLRQQGLAACRTHLARVPGAEAARNELSEAELAVCRRMELDPAAYRRAKIGDA